MPRLSAKQVTTVEEAEEVQTTFEAWPAGKYKAVFDRIDIRDSQAGNEYWSAVFRDFEDIDGEKQRGRQWLNIQLPQSKMPKDYLPKKMRDDGLTVKEVLADEELTEKRETSWKQYQGLVAARLKEFYGAFGYTPDSDTEEFEGEECGIELSVITQNFGRNQGKKVNQIERVFPVEDLGWDDSDGGGQDF